METGAWRSAVAVWDQCLSVDKTCIPALMSKAAVAMSNSKFDDAAVLYGTARTLRPCCSTPHVMLGIAQYHAGKHEDAIMTFDKCLLTLEAASVCAPQCHADALITWPGVDVESGVPFPKAFSKVDVMVWVSRCLHALGDLQNAINIVNRVIRVRSRSACLRGCACAHPRAPVAQEADDNIAGLLQYAKSCVTLGRVDGALQALLRLVVASSKHKDVRRVLAAVLADASAIPVLEEQLPFTVDAAPALAFLANILKVSAGCCSNPRSRTCA